MSCSQRAVHADPAALGSSCVLRLLLAEVARVTWSGAQLRCQSSHISKPATGASCANPTLAIVRHGTHSLCNSQSGIRINWQAEVSRCDGSPECCALSKKSHAARRQSRGSRSERSHHADRTSAHLWTIRQSRAAGGLPRRGGARCTIVSRVALAHARAVRRAFFGTKATRRAVHRSTIDAVSTSFAHGLIEVQPRSSSDGVVSRGSQRKRSHTSWAVRRRA